MKIKSIKPAVVFVSVLMLSFGISSVSYAEKKQEAKQLASLAAAGRVVYAEKITKKSYAKKTVKPRKARRAGSYNLRLFTLNYEEKAADRLKSAIQGWGAHSGRGMLYSSQLLTNSKFNQTDGLSPLLAGSPYLKFPKSTNRQQDMATIDNRRNDVRFNDDNPQSPVLAPYKYQSKYTDNLISLAVPIAATDSLTIAPVISYALPANGLERSDVIMRLIDKNAEIVYGGINLMFAF